MSNYLVDGADLTSIANAIRTKGETSASLEFPTDFISAIAAIPTSSGVTVKTATGTFAGTGTSTATIPCSFDPDIVFFYNGVTSETFTGAVALLIVRGLISTCRCRNNTTSNTNGVNGPYITDLNTDGSSYNYKAVYSNGNVTLTAFSTSARCKLTSGKTYSYQFIKYTA